MIPEERHNRKTILHDRNLANKLPMKLLLQPVTISETQMVNYLLQSVT